MGDVQVGAQTCKSVRALEEVSSKFKPGTAHPLVVERSTSCLLLAHGQSAAHGACVCWFTPDGEKVKLNVQF